MSTVPGRSGPGLRKLAGERGLANAFHGVAAHTRAERARAGAEIKLMEAQRVAAGDRTASHCAAARIIVDVRSHVGEIADEPASSVARCRPLACLQEAWIDAGRDRA